MFIFNYQPPSIWVLCATFAMTGLGAPQVYSQDDLAIEEITVTARKREERLQEVPLSISAYSAADIESKSLASLKDIGQFTPNFSFSNQGQAGSSGSVVFMRGIGQADPNISWDPGVGIYVDGVYLGRMQGIDLGLMDLERVEVLRGPQGTLFGKNTIGGAVNVVTTKPGDEFSASAEITTGRYDRLDGKVNVNVPLIPDVLAMKVAVSSQNRDGFGKRIDFNSGEKIDEMGDRERMNGRVSINWTPSEDVGILFSLDGAKIKEYGAVREVQLFTSPPLAGLMNMFVPIAYNAANFATDSHFTSFANGENGAPL